ncbi:MAG TPA: hypothetical protein VFI65_20450 [Streptosporangiaceae bacterium]|nr:hypothetical protein [Streptosporangiaceae bacterium]
MSQIEVHLRQALADVADEVPADSVPPLNLLADTDNVVHLASHRGTDRRRWLAPAAAAVAVLAVTAGIAVSASLPRPPQTSDVSQRVPSYYIGTPDPVGQDGGRAAIYATGSGRQIMVVRYRRAPIPAIGATAAADGRTFVIVGSGTNSHGLSLYIARFDPATRKLKVALLSEPSLRSSDFLETLALSPDGTRLAVMFRRGESHSPRSVGQVTWVTVANLNTGVTRSWTSASGTLQQDAAGPVLSWANDDKTLAFPWLPGLRAGSSSPPHRGSGVRILDTSGLGGDLIADSRMALPFIVTKGVLTVSAGYFTPAQITPDGRHLVLGVLTSNGPEFASYSVATGKLERLFGQRTNPLSAGSVSTAPVVLWASGDGRTLVASDPPGRRQVGLGIVRGGHVTKLPQPPHISPLTSSW